MAVLLLACSTKCDAQDTGFVQSAFADLTISLGDASTSVQCFEGARNADPLSPKVYAFSPYFEFVKYTADGKAYQLLNAPGSKQNVKLRLALYDDTLKSAAALWISKQTNAAVSINSVLPLPIYSLTITENNTGVTTTLPQGPVGPNVSLVLAPQMDIYFRDLSPDIAAQLTQAIASNDTDFSFTYYYKTSSTALGAYTITYDDVHRNNVFNQLTGDGGVGLVTRAGVTRISGEIAQSMNVTSYCEDSSCSSSLAQDLVNLFTDKMQFNKTIEFTDVSQLAQLNQLTIDPRGKDFEAATLNTIHDAVVTSHDYNDLNHKILDAHLKGGYGPFTADGGFTSNSEVNKAIKDTFSHDWSGNDWSTVPKTINIYQLNGSDFKGAATVRQVNVKATFSMRSFQNNPVQAFLSVAELANAVKSSSTDRFVLVPIGTVLSYSGPTDGAHVLPSSWLQCDGSSLSGSKYPELLAAIGTLYGDGHDSTGAKTGDFNLPDYRGMFLRGVDPSKNLDKGQRSGDGLVGSKESFSTARPANNFVTDTQGIHSHVLDFEISAGRSGSVVSNTVANPRLPGGPQKSTEQSGAHSHTVTGGGDAETRPVNAAVTWIIRAQ
jgi:microcystin-dependent protein